jgi:hypothetical protein
MITKDGSELLSKLYGVMNLTGGGNNASYSEKAHAASLIMRHSKTYKRDAETLCNGQANDYSDYGQRTGNWAQVDAWRKRDIAKAEKRSESIEEKITELVKWFDIPGVDAVFEGDPRGYVVKLSLPRAAHSMSNTMDRDTLGVF